MLVEGSTRGDQTMHWEAEPDEEHTAVPEAVVDLVFDIRCRALPVDHAWDLFAAIAPHLPWLESEPLAGIHPLHVAESAHGWQRPQHPDALLNLSRRTRLVLRLPAERVGAARRLEGKHLRVGRHGMIVCEATTLPLSRSHSLFSRRVAIGEDESEEAFVGRLIEEMRAIDVRPKRILPGLAHSLRTPQGKLCTRLLSVEEMSLEESFRLQMQGLGTHRHLGCGIFIPHKPLSAVRV
jgi:CRISPR-associated protein Cas6